MRNGAKIAAVISNARLLVDLADKHGSAAFFAARPSEDYVGLLRFVEKQGARLGGLIGQPAFREMGRDGFLLSEDVIRRLQVEGLVSRPPKSQRDMEAVQRAFNIWMAQSNMSLTVISRTPNGSAEVTSLLLMSAS